MDMYLDKRTYKIFNSIFGRIIMSLIYITPKIYILNGIITENYDKFLYLELLQIICLILFTSNWVNYFNWRRKYKKEEKIHIFAWIRDKTKSRENAIKNIVISIFIMILSMAVLVWTKILPDLSFGKNVIALLQVVMTLVFSVSIMSLYWNVHEMNGGYYGEIWSIFNSY